MRCPQCQFDNRDTARFCEECGSRLVWTCPGCGVEVSPRANFCSECGTQLTAAALSHGISQINSQREAQATPIKPSPMDREAPEAERRQLTVLFCDLVESTALSGRLDPEELREVVKAYQAVCAEVIQRYDGHIAQYLGDGLLVYFGYPLAHEDDARRAIHTGLGMVEAIRELNTRLAQNKGIQLAVRVGIHTGLVVVGEIGGGGRQERLALGETPNVAARIQGIAAPDTVVISAATLHLVQGYFTATALGPQTLKGVTAPVPVYRVMGASAAQSRLDVAVATGLTPLVGRESEVALLLERWEQSKAGLGQVVLLSGEGGLGKSRLVEVMRERVVSEDPPRIAFRCSPYHTNSALYPVIEHLQQLLAWRRDDAPTAKLDTLESVLRAYRLAVDEVAPLLAALLSVPVPDGRYHPLRLTPQQQRQRTLDALVAWLLAEAERQPVLAVWEDVHWADPSTLELLGLVIEQVPTARLLTLVTYRPEFRLPWAPRSHLTQLTLSRLPRPQVETMVRQLTGNKPLPAEVLAQVVAKTDGVPLFVEELVKMLLESGLVREEADRYVLTGPLPPLAIPVTLHDSLMARLDRLSTARTVAQLGAVLGREFVYELIQALALLDDTTLQRGLAQLVDAELLYQRGRPPQARYLFKHALIQEAAYQSLLKSTRQQYHQRVARVLEERFPETVETQPELLAHHYTEAALIAQAVPYWQCAGERAMQRSAFVEAISHLTRGLEALKTLPDPALRARQEVGLQIALGQSLITTKGQAAAEVGDAYRRAKELCQQAGETAQLFRVLHGLWHFHGVRAELGTVVELSAELLSLAQSVQDRAYLMGAHWEMAGALFLLGRFTEARQHWEQSIACYDPQRHRADTTLFGFDLGVFSLCWLPHALWHLGYPEQALTKSREALALAQQLSHPFSLAVALDYAGMLHQFLQEERAAYEQAHEAIAICEEQGFAYYRAWAVIIQGWTLTRGRQIAQGITQMRQGLSALRATGAELRRPYYLSLLAGAYGNAGHIEEGLSMLDEALALVDKTGERWPEAELHRLKGELLLQQAAGVPLKAGDVNEAEICFHRALDVARRQQAKSPELRAAMSLSRLWRQQGKRQEAHQLLAPSYSWFTEGFDTADLQAAKALLQELA